MQSIWVCLGKSAIVHCPESGQSYKDPEKRRTQLGKRQDAERLSPKGRKSVKVSNIRPK